MTAIIGLTGGIASGKTQTATFFRERGIAVFDDDACVHELYRSAFADEVEALFPGVKGASGIDRERLSKHLQKHPEDFTSLNQLVHKRVAHERALFLTEAKKRKDPFVVFDSPLLYETGLDQRVDLVLVAWVDQKTQTERALERPGMSADKLALITKHQLDLDDKRRRADLVLDTSLGLAVTKKTVDELIERWLYMPPSGGQALVKNAADH